MEPNPSHWLGAALIDSHGYLEGECTLVGPATVEGIQSFLAGLPQAPSMTVSPGFQPDAIHRSDQ